MGQGLLEGFRQAPANYSAAARYAGIGWKAARTAWQNGWPDYPWAPPIRDIIGQEEAKSRISVASRLQDEKRADDAERERERAAQRKAREEEELMLSHARRNVMAIYGLSLKLTAAIDALVGKVRAEFLDATGRPKAPSQINVTPDDALKLWERHSRILLRANSMAQDLVQLGRTDRGKLNTLVGIKPVADMTPEQAAEEIEAQEPLLQLIREEAQERDAKGSFIERRTVSGPPKTRDIKAWIESLVGGEYWTLEGVAEPCLPDERDPPEYARFVEVLNQGRPVIEPLLISWTGQEEADRMPPLRLVPQDYRDQLARAASSLQQSTTDETPRVEPASTPVEPPAPLPPTRRQKGQGVVYMPALSSALEELVQAAELLQENKVAGALKLIASARRRLDNIGDPDA